MTGLPVSSSPTEGGVEAPGREGAAMVRGIVIAWEKLRLLYNVVLLPLGLIAATLCITNTSPGINLGWVTSSGPVLDIIFQSVVFGIGANICYCLGPYLELVFAGLGYSMSGRRIRPFIFGVGLLVSLFPIVSAILIFGLL